MEAYLFSSQLLHPLSQAILYFSLNQYFWNHHLEVNTVKIYLQIPEFYPEIT